MPKFTARHSPPIESVLVRAIFVTPSNINVWQVMHTFTQDGANPDSSPAIMLVGVNAMVLHHATCEEEDGRKSAVVSIPNSPFILTVDAACVQAKPFGQQIRDAQMSVLRQSGLQFCSVCGGSGQVPVHADPDVEMMSMNVGPCPGCQGQGIIPIERQPERPAPKPTPTVSDPELEAKIVRLMKETGSSKVECEIALKTWASDYDRALKWMDDSRLGGGEKR